MKVYDAGNETVARSRNQPPPPKAQAGIMQNSKFDVSCVKDPTL